MQQITCQQCGRTLVPTAAGSVVCPSCGYTMAAPMQPAPAGAAGLDDSATRPVPPEVVAAAVMPVTLPQQEQPTSPPPPPLDAQTVTAASLGAYTPPSLPRSRADAPAEPIPVGGDETRDDLRATPTELLRGRDPQHDTKPVDGAMVQAAVTRGGKRNRWTLLSAIALMIVLALGTAAALLAANGKLDTLFAPLVPATPIAVPTATAGPPAPPAGFTRYTAPDGTFTLVVPSAWVSATDNQLTVFTDGQTSVNFELESLPGQLDPQTVSQDFLSKLSTLLAGNTGSAQLGPPTQDIVPVAGTVWTRIAADLTITSAGSSVPWHVVVLAAQHDNETLLIAYYAPRTLFASEDATHFQVMLGSLMLLSPQP